MKIANPPEKSHPLFPNKPPLKVEVLSSPTPFLKIWLEVQPPLPLAESGGVVHYDALLFLDDNVDEECE